MPFPFNLPTTSSFVFSTSFESPSHPSLPLTASTHRSVLRSALKTHKRLAPANQASNLPSLLGALTTYLPFLFALDAGLSNTTADVDVVLKSTPSLEWRPVVTTSHIPGREPPRIKLDSLEYEVLFVLATTAYTHTLLARAALQPLYSTSAASPSPQTRTAAIFAATKHLLTSASIHAYISSRAASLSESKIPTVELLPSTHTALSELALAEATLLAVLKDDPYPAAVAQDRNKNDKEWMIHAPSIPKVRVHLFARICSAASEHAAKANALLSSSNSFKGPGGTAKVSPDLVSYTNALRLSSRAKACRFLGIDSELAVQTGIALAWLSAGFSTLGLESKHTSSSDKVKSGLSMSKLKLSWSEKREDKKVEKGAVWGMDAGKAEEGRVLEMLEQKWAKMNDTINTQVVPPSGPLLATIPSGRDCHTVQPYVPPALDAAILGEMRAPPEGDEIAGEEGADSSDDEVMGGGSGAKGMAGAFPGTGTDYGGSRTGTPAYY